MLFFCIFVLRSRKRFRIRSSVVINVLDLNGLYSCGEAAHLIASVRLALAGSKTWQRLADGYLSARRGKSLDSADLSAMATVFPGVCSERRQKSPRLPEGKAAESFCAESIEWKSRSQRSGGGA